MRQGAKLYSARTLPKSETLAEKRLWEQLRNRTLEGFKFSRQVRIGPYIVDFACREQRSIVEVDGATHSTEEELVHDNRRTEFLKSGGEVRGTRSKCPHLSHVTSCHGPLSSPASQEKT